MVNRKRIMVVNDDHNTLQILNRTLELESFDTILFSDSHAALKLMENIHPDLVILDGMIPGLDGFQTLDLIHEHSNVPVIMLSGNHKEPALQKALFLGTDDYIYKPFNPKSLIARIQAKLWHSTQQV